LDAHRVDARPWITLFFQANLAVMPLGPAGGSLAPGPLGAGPTKTGISYETDVQAPQSETREQARISGPHEHARRAEDPQSPSPSRSACLGRAHRIEIRPVAGGRLSAGSSAHDSERRKERLPRGFRLRRRSEISAAFRAGMRTRTPLADVLVRIRSAPCAPRFGLVVPKLGHSIVARNRLKRRLRQIGRRRVLTRLREDGVAADVLVVAKRRAYKASYRQLTDAVTGAVRGSELAE